MVRRHTQRTNRHPRTRTLPGSTHLVTNTENTILTTHTAHILTTHTLITPSTHTAHTAQGLDPSQSIRHTAWRCQPMLYMCVTSGVTCPALAF